MWLDGAVVTGWLDGVFFEGFEVCGVSALPGLVRPAREMGDVLPSRDGAR